MATTAGGKKGGKGSKKGKPPVKKKNKRGIRSRDAQDRRIQSGQAKRLARASQGQGASSAEAPRQVVFIAIITVHYVRVRWRRVCGFLYEFG